MGVPAHFSLELPRRCMKLIEELLPTVGAVFADDDRRDLGGLTSTFLISMAGPIVVLPIERIERHQQKKDREGYADDRRLNPALSRSLKDVLGGGKFRRARFFVPGHWSFAERVADFNIADGLPDDVSGALASKEAFDRAAGLETSKWSSCLRNALAHGGIVYLNEDGRSAYDGGPVKMFCFVSGKYAERTDETPEAINCLRIREEHFLEFLRRWVAWLETSSLLNEIAA
jgi:hypothetical protein